MGEPAEEHFIANVPRGVTVWDADPYSPEALRDPGAFYRELRQHGPFVYLSRYGMLACGNHQEVALVLSDWERFVSSRGIGHFDYRKVKPWRQLGVLLETDPPEHARARRAMMRALSPSIMRALQQVFRKAADSLVGKLLTQGSIDGVTDVAQAFALSVFPGAVGLKDPDCAKLIDYGTMSLNANGPDNELRRNSFALAPILSPWAEEQCRRASLQQGGFGDLIYQAVDAGEITEAEAGNLVRSLLAAGLDTTIAGISSALNCLAENPGQFALLKLSPDLARQAFEEAQRLCSPAHTICRTANVDTQVGEVFIHEGTKILCSIGAANLDPQRWEQPLRFDIHRKPYGHVAFGNGIHTCVGQNVSRAEGEAVLRALAQQVARIDKAGPAVWGMNNTLRALERLPVRFH